jgi:hypothetical protein
MYCSNCGNSLGDSAKFCGNCGKKVLINKNVKKESKEKQSSKKDFVKEKGKKNCPSCGELNEEKAIGCIKCGQVFSDGNSKKKEKPPVKKSQELKKNEETEKTIKEKVEGDLSLEELRKVVKSAGDSVFAVGIFNLVVEIFLSFFNYSEGLLDEVGLILGLIFVSVIYGLLIKWGKKLKDDNLEDPISTKKKVGQLIIYTFVIIGIGLLSGSLPGIIVIILLFYLFKANKRLKTYIEEN